MVVTVQHSCVAGCVGCITILMVAEDPQQRNGVGTIRTLLSNERMPIPRDFIRHVLSEHAPEGLAAQFPGVKRIKRSALHVIGPFHQDHQDGHDKLNAQALQMGDVSLPIYGIKDQWTSFIKHLVTVPDNRLAMTIEHVHLDCVEKFVAVSVTSVMDKGASKLTFKCVLGMSHLSLSYIYAPDIDPEFYPPVLQIKSVHNTPIEGLWQLLKTHGNDFKDIVKGGYRDGIYNPNHATHVKLFKWLWPKILQCQLDAFVKYWNNHRTTPRHAFTCPGSLGGQDCRIPVEKNTLDALRAEIPVSRLDAMRWVDDSFAERAQNAYERIGSPLLVPARGWSVFRSILAELEA
ncbi:hypothetical protein FPV67DRAFT_1558519 [Lyophyllum atratum]|nr:hypothetical protein FPV67DRAFT_1558519 [Lyophyllum atratum]